MSSVLLLISFTVCLATYIFMRQVLGDKNLAHRIARKTAGVLSVVLVVALLLPTPTYATTITEYQIPGNPGVWDLAVTSTHVWYTEGAGNAIGIIAHSNNTFPPPLRRIPVPTPNSQPWGIASLPPTINGATNPMAVVFTESYSNRIGVVLQYSFNNSFNIAEYRIPTDGSSPRKIIYDSRANRWCAWFTEYIGKIGRFNVTAATTDPNFLEYTLPAGSAPIGVAVDTIGVYVWYADFGRKSIGRLNPDTGVIREYSVYPFSPWDVTVDSNGIVWFTGQQLGTANNIIGRLTPELNENAAGYQPRWPLDTYMIPTPNCEVHDIEVDSIGNVWFTEYADNVGKVGKFTPIVNSFTEYTILTPNAKPQGLTIFQDNIGVRNIWFTEYGGRRIARLRQPEGPTVTSTVYSLSSLVSTSSSVAQTTSWPASTTSTNFHLISTGTSYYPITTASTTSSTLTDTSSTIILSQTYFSTTYTYTTSTSWTTSTTTLTYTILSGETTSTTTSVTVTVVSVSWQSFTLQTTATYVSTSLSTQTTSTTLTTTQNITVFSPTVSMPTTTSVGLSTTVYSPIVTATSTTLTETTTTTTSTIPTTTTLYSPTVTVTSSTTTVSTVLPLSAIRPCIIASAAYESELAAPVQFLREFRNQDVLSTFAGARFMDVFNSFYYSFSPAVASVVTSSSALKTLVRAVIYPLVSILGLSSVLFNAFARTPEVGMMMAGLFASAMLGIVYVTPSVIVIRYLIKRSMLRRIATVLSRSRT